MPADSRSRRRTVSSFLPAQRIRPIGDSSSFLALDEGESHADLEDERFDLAEDGRFQISLGVGILESQKIQHIRIAEHEVGSELVILPQSRKLLCDQLVRLAREGCALEEHGL